MIRRRCAKGTITGQVVAVVLVTPGGGGVPVVAPWFTCSVYCRTHRKIGYTSTTESFVAAS